MAKKIAIALAVLLLVLILVIVTRPGEYSIERSAEVSAPPEVTYEQIADLREWSEWSPWDKRDPNLEQTYTGADSGEGAVYEWSGNQEVGRGRMTIVEAVPNERVKIELEFIEPFASKSLTTFDLEPTDDGTNVSWRMDGTNDFMGKAMSLVFDMDAMIGNDFEEGLAGLDRAAQAAAEDGAAADGAGAAPSESGAVDGDQARGEGS